MIKIELNKNEYDYLRYASFLTKNYQNLILSSTQVENGYLLKVSCEEADEIRDLCGEQLQLVGFNKEYNLTLEGAILESLIDKFYIG
jgi:hypothetical protein